MQPPHFTAVGGDASQGYEHLDQWIWPIQYMLDEVSPLTAVKCPIKWIFNEVNPDPNTVKLGLGL